MENHQFELLEKKSGYHFQNPHLLKQAMTHSSYANEHKAKGYHDNERLEFLGDAVLEVVSSEFLFRTLSGAAGGRSDQAACEYGL